MKLILLLVIVVAVTFKAAAQRPCESDSYKEQILKTEPKLNGLIATDEKDRFLARKLRNLDSIITIYVVVHVLYNPGNIAEKLPQSQIDDQFEQVNKDFSAKNEDVALVPECFKKKVVDCKIRFARLGNIDYQKTQREVFYCKDRNGKDENTEKIKFAAYGGADATATSQVLNVWIGNISDGPFDRELLGFGTFPGKVDKFDGIVLSYKAVGANNGKGYLSCGRTLTHELGHWLDVFHLWGDTKCGDDFVAETPRQKEETYGLPAFPQPSCDSDTTGIMFMNFMDYTNDDGRHMFTAGQRDRMRALFVEGGKRSSMMKFADNFSIADSVRRNDILTPLIKAIDDVNDSKKSRGVSKKVSWRIVDSADYYYVYVAQPGIQNWSRTKTTKGELLINNLIPDQIYEVKISSVLKDGTETTNSPPYLFYTTK